MILRIKIIFFVIILISCKPKIRTPELAKQLIENETSNVAIIVKNNAKIDNGITCTDHNCSGLYSGAEFINGADIAHQFSNKMSKAVGNKLKELYRNEDYKKVDFSLIRMTTKGMGTGAVVYKLYIPFISVGSKCDAYTSFDHVGGWNHAPALERRKKELQNVTIKGDTLQISDLKLTPEGLQEYWIQWKNKTIQIDCQ